MKNQTGIVIGGVALVGLLAVIGLIFGRAGGSSGPVASTGNFACASAVPGVAAAPLPVKSADLTLITYTVASDAAGYVNVLGAYCNSTGEMRGDVEIGVTLRDAAGAVVGSGSESLGTLLVSWPGEKFPFNMRIPSTGKTAKVEFQISSKPSGARPLLGPEVTRDLKVTNTNVKPSSAGGVVLGELTNAAARKFLRARIAVIAYDGRGNILAARIGEAAIGKLATGASTSFKLDMSTLTAEPAAVDYIAEGWQDD